MASRFEISADRQAAENERERAATAKALQEAASYQTTDVKAEAERVMLYWHHRQAGSPGTHYLMYPMDPGARRFYADQERYQFPNDRDDDWER